MAEPCQGQRRALPCPARPDSELPFGGGGRHTGEPERPDVGAVHLGQISEGSHHFLPARHPGLPPGCPFHVQSESPLGVLQPGPVRAPSRTTWSASWAGSWLPAGYIVLMPDYPGFGSNTSAHPYVHMSLGNSVRDLIAAVSLQTPGRQGGSEREDFPHGVLRGWLFHHGRRPGCPERHQLASRSPPFSSASIKAVVPCDGPYDISGVMLQQMVQLNTHVLAPSYIMYTAFGYQFGVSDWISSSATFSIRRMMRSRARSSMGHTPTRMSARRCRPASSLPPTSSPRAPWQPTGTVPHSRT